MSIKSQNIVGVTLWCQLSHQILLGSNGGVNFVTKYIVIVLVVYLEGISNITGQSPSIRPQPPPPSALYLYTILFLLINIVGVSEVSQDKFDDAFKNMLPVTNVSIRMTLPLEDSQRFVACDFCQ